MLDYKKYGYFSGRSFIITRPDTPRPWLNYIANQKYCVRFSQTGGGDSFYRFPRINSVTYAHFDDATELLDDRPGRWVYLRDTDNGELWSVNWQPVMKASQKFSCTHAPGYSQIDSETCDIESQLRLFVPLNDPVEIWTVSIKNNRKHTANLEAFPFVEWLLTDDICKCGFMAGNHAEFIPAENMIYTWYGKARLPEQNYAAFMSADFIADSYQLSRRNFLGRYGTYQQPEAILAGLPITGPIDYEPSVGVLKKALRIEPGSTITFQIRIGSVNSREEACVLKNKYSSPAIVEKEFQDVISYWDKRLSTAQVQTPDEEFNHFVNTWLKYQVHHTSYWIRPGGAKGYRDVCQDSENILPFDAPRTRSLLLEAMKYQYSSGRTVRQWPQHPTGQLDTRDYRDSPIWLVYSICEYLKETGDFDFLKITVPFLDQGQSTVYDRIRTTIDCLWNDRGDHGLSHIGRGDWNDGLDEVGQKGRGESVWLSMALYKGLTEASSLAGFLNDNKLAEYDHRAEALKAIINNVAWDGKWYLRAFNDDGEVIGSDTCDEGKIFLLPQAWAMFCGLSNEHQNEQMISAVRELMTDFGPIKMSPIYKTKHDGIGKIAYYPGFAESGAVYLHAVSFLIAGLCEIGRADEAFDLWKRIAPTNPKNNSDICLCEPYVFPSFYMGPQTSCPGRSLYSWLTASGGWMFKNGLARICGIRPTYAGLDIRPCLPKHWPQVQMVRHFRNAWFDIDIRQTGIKHTTVNGKAQQLPISKIVAGSRYKVDLTI